MGRGCGSGSNGASPGRAHVGARCRRNPLWPPALPPPDERITRPPRSSSSAGGAADRGSMPTPTCDVARAPVKPQKTQGGAECGGEAARWARSGRPSACLQAPCGCLHPTSAYPAVRPGCRARAPQHGFVHEPTRTARTGERDTPAPCGHPRERGGPGVFPAPGPVWNALV
jgi:hypothetical protein